MSSKSKKYRKNKTITPNNFTQKQFFNAGGKRISIKSLIKKLPEEDKNKLKNIFKKIKPNIKKNITDKKQKIIMTPEEKYYYNRYYLNKFNSAVNNKDDYMIFKNQKEIDDEKIKVIIEIAREQITTTSEIEGKIIEMEVAKGNDLNKEELINFYEGNILSNKIKKEFELAELKDTLSFLEEYISHNIYDKQIHYMNNNKSMKNFIKEYNENYKTDEGFEKVKILPNYIFTGVKNSIG